MKRITFLATLLALVAAGGYLFYQGRQLPSGLPDGGGQHSVAPPVTPADSPSGVQEPPLQQAVRHDPLEVFQRAFWRRPTAEDRILHAERREWQDEGEVRRWQWFLVVEPSPSLVEYLRVENAFSLEPASSLQETGPRPAWFTPEASAADILRAPRGRMQLVFSKGQNLLYATDSGGGFQAGMAEPLPQAPPVPAGPSGRLPDGPPPDPRR